MSRPNVLLVNLPPTNYDRLASDIIGSNNTQHDLAIPLGLLHLSAEIKAADARVTLFDFALAATRAHNCADVDDFIAREIDKLAGHAPDLIGISLLFSSSHRFFEHAGPAVRKAWPSARIVVGGIHATNATRHLLACDFVDYVIRGEGERSLVEFVTDVASGREPQFAGLYARTNPPPANQPLECCEPVDDLATLAAPDWDLVDMHRYVSSGGARRRLGDSARRRSASIMTSRGCPLQCSFCSAHTVHGRKLRFRPVEHVVEEIATLHRRYGVTLFTPRDDLLTANRRRLITLLDAIKALGIADIELQFPNGLHVNTLDEEILDRLIELGTRTVNLAIESGSDYAQRHIIRKHCNLAKARRLVRQCRSRGLITRCYFIFGFPRETRQLMAESADFIRNLGADWCAILTATPLVGSDMYNEFLADGCFEESVDLWSNTGFFARRQFDTPEITADELNEFVYRLNLEVNFLNNVNLRHPDGRPPDYVEADCVRSDYKRTDYERADYERAVALFTDIAMAYPFHLFAWHGLSRAYTALGQFNKAAASVRSARQALANDPRAVEMMTRYGHLLPADFLDQPTPTATEIEAA